MLWTQGVGSLRIVGQSRRGALGAEESPRATWEGRAHLAGGAGIPAPGHQALQLHRVLLHKLLTLRKEKDTVWVGPGWAPALRALLPCRPGLSISLGHSRLPLTPRRSRHQTLMHLAGAGM